MSKRQTVGYIVRSYNDRSVNEISDGGILCIGFTGTLFHTRRQARAAIRRTHAYARAHNMPWEFDHWIMRITKPSE